MTAYREKKSVANIWGCFGGSSVAFFKNLFHFFIIEQVEF